MFNTFFQKPKKPPEYFAALSFNKDIIQAAVFTLENSKVNILGTASEKYSGNFDQLVEIADSAISQAAVKIDLQLVKKIIFGFPPSFLDGDKISAKILPYLKKITSELELVPSGFVAIPEALNFYLEEKEGGPQTSILIGVTKEDLTISHFRGGRLSEQTTVIRSEYITRDIEKALNEFSEVEIFPSKILLYDGGDLETVKDELLKYPWQQNNKFLHFPKINSLSPEICMLSVIKAAASEMMKNLPDMVYEEPSKTIIKPESKQSEITSHKVSPERLGFTREENDLFINKEAQIKELFGEKKNSGFNLFSKLKLPWFKQKPEEDLDLNEEKYNEDKENPLQGRNFLNLNLKGKAKYLIIAVFLVGFIFAGYTFASYTLPKATLLLIVDPKVFDQQKEVIINPDTSTVDEVKNEIPGKILEAEVTGTKTIGASGKKIIGDQAKGTVTLYNKTTSTRTFDKGTKLTAKNLTFTLNDKIEVSGATESADGLSYGKANMTVSADKIGADGNLPTQTEFSVTDFSTSSYSARNSQAFSGGTSREVTAVSSKDQDTLLADLSKELKDQALKDLTGKLVNGEKLLDESISPEIQSRKFSHEPGQETKDIVLDLTVKYKVLVYKTSDLDQLIEKIVQTNIPDGYEYKPEQTTYEISQTVIDQENRTAHFIADFKVKLFPKINTEKIKNEVLGLVQEKLDNYIKTVSYVVGYEIKYQTPFSLFQDTLPKSAKNITIEIKAR